MNSSPSISLSNIFKQAFEQTKTNLNAFLPLLLTLLLIVVYAANTYIGEIDLSDEAAFGEFQHKANIAGLIGLVLTPIEIGFMLMGVKASRGLTLRTIDIFAIIPDSPKIIILALLSFVVIQLGLALLVLPGLFLMAMLSMAQPLMVDYRLTMIEAVKRSVRKCYYHAGLVVQMYAVLIIIIIVTSIFTYGIALLLTIPFYVNAKGILYCELFDKQ